jgi:ribosomal-protein-alanine N-acetyltransferase
MTITVRKMQPGDIPAVVQIDRTAFSLPWPESSYRYEVQSNRAARCFVAENESDHEIVAMIVSWMIVDELHIATIATHIDHRRMGIGSKLLEEALHDACSLGARRAFLEVRESNAAAQEMYQKFGFKVTGRRPGYYRDNNEDAMLMTLEPLEAS